MKKRVVKAKNRNKTAKKQDSRLKYFIFGSFLFFAIEVIFMPEGIFIEKIMNVAMTGLPSVIGLTIVLIAGIILFQKSKYILLGSFTFAVLSPVFLIIMALFGVEFLNPYFYYSIAYLFLIIAFVWIYFIFRIIKESGLK